MRKLDSKCQSHFKTLPSHSNAAALNAESTRREQIGKHEGKSGCMLTRRNNPDKELQTGCPNIAGERLGKKDKQNKQQKKPAGRDLNGLHLTKVTAGSWKSEG